MQRENTNSVISWMLLSLVEETGVPGENHQTAKSYCQALLHKVVCIPRHVS